MDCNRCFIKCLSFNSDINHIFVFKKKENDIETSLVRLIDWVTIRYDYIKFIRRTNSKSGRGNEIKSIL